MRTKEAMVLLLVAAALFGFFFHLGECQVSANPVGCKQWPCSDVYGWWSGQLTPPQQSFTAEMAGTPAPPPNPGANDHTTQALQQLYIPSSTGKTPLNAAGNYDMFVWPNNTPNCFNAGVYPVPQQSMPAGSPAAVYTRGNPRYTCS